MRVQCLRLRDCCRKHGCVSGDTSSDECCLCGGLLGCSHHSPVIFLPRCDSRRLLSRSRGKRVPVVVESSHESAAAGRRRGPRCQRRRRRPRAGGPQHYYTLALVPAGRHRVTAAVGRVGSHSSSRRAGRHHRCLLPRRSGAPFLLCLGGGPPLLHWRCCTALAAEAHVFGTTASPLARPCLPAPNRVAMPLLPVPLIVPGAKALVHDTLPQQAITAAASIAAFAQPRTGFSSAPPLAVAPARLLRERQRQM